MASTEYHPTVQIHGFEDVVAGYKAAIPEYQDLLKNESDPTQIEIYKSSLEMALQDVVWLESGKQDDILEVYYKELGQRNLNQDRFFRAESEAEKKRFATNALNSNEYAKAIGEHLNLSAIRWEITKLDLARIPPRDNQTGRLKLR